MRSSIDLAWAAGFLEGEGSFGNSGCPAVTAAQVQKEPIDRLTALFGGSVKLRTTKGFSTKPIWVWRVNTHRSVEVMMTLYVLMSPKRKGEIERALTLWKTSRLMKRRGSGLCGRGHLLSGYNAFRVNGYIKCRTCKNDVRREWRARRKEQPSLVSV